MPEPAWDRLPHDPQAFFALDDGFDRKDLKRAYTRLIRVFKPERHPEEFQRIRAAYEMLDERLRYLGSAPEGMPLVVEPTSSARSGDSPRPEATPDPEPVLDLAATLETDGPTGVRDDLRSAPRLSPADWIRLALIEETLDPTGDTVLVTLLEAHERGGADGRVQHVLRTVIRDGAPDGRTAPWINLLLNATLQGRAGWPPMHFWFLSEPLWLALLDEIPFARFAAAFEKASRAIGEDGWQGRLVLLTRLVRRAAFLADETWMSEAVGELEEHYDQLSAWQQHELDVTDWLLPYVEVRQEFLDAAPGREAFDAAMVEVVRGDEPSADRQVLRLFGAVLDSPAAALASFPPDRPSFGVPYALSLYAGEAADRQGLGGVRELTPTVEREVAAFLWRVQRRTGRNPNDWARSALNLALLGLALLWVIAPAIVLANVDGEVLPVLWGLPLVSLGLLWLFATRGPLFELHTRCEGPFLRNLHRKIWRPMTTEFLVESHIPLAALANVGKRMEKKPDDLDEYLEAVMEDDGLNVLAMALRFS